MLSFNIMTPGTPQRAAFQKNRCSYARAIIGGKSLNIRDHHFELSLK